MVFDVTPIVASAGALVLIRDVLGEQQQLMVDIPCIILYVEIE